MGVLFAAGTREGVTIFSISEDETVKLYEISGKICLAVKYSNGGHYLAVGSY